MKIVEALSGWSEYFTLRPDALNRPGFSPIHKCTVAHRQLQSDLIEHIWNKFGHRSN